MSVYPERRNGRLTGRFVVEVQIGGKRLRKVTGDYAQTKAIEDELVMQVASGEGKPKLDHREGVHPKTVAELLVRGEGPLWGNTSIHRSAPAAIKRIAGIIGTVKKLKDISTHDIDKVVAGLRREGLAPATINRNLSAFHRLVAWGKERGWGPTANISIPWQEEPEQTLRLINDGDDQRIVDQLCSQGSKGVLVADFVKVLLVTGLRRGELLSRTPDDLYTSQGRTWLRVTKTKTKRERAVPLTPDAEAILRTRLPWKVYAHDVRAQWDKAREALGLGPDAVLHATRHTFGTRLVRNGVDPFTLKELMGHQTLSTTQRYVHVAGAQKVAAVDSLDLTPVTRGVGEHRVGDTPAKSPTERQEQNQ